MTSASLEAPLAKPHSARSVHAFVRRRRRARRLSLFAMGGALLLAVVVGVSMGAVSIPWAASLRILLSWLGMGATADLPQHWTQVLLSIRLPRVLLGVLVGASLAIAGAAMQGLFRNPLADPGLIGVSSGAALGAVSLIVLGVRVSWSIPPVMVPLAAFAGGLAATLLVYRLATRDGRTETATLLLAGIAINAVAGALLGLLILVADDAQLRTVTLWMLGSLSGATWSVLPWVAATAAIGGALLLLQASALNAFLLGEDAAGHTGLDVMAVRRRVVLGATLLVGAAVAFSGMIGFVGLVVPHVVRLVLGPDHRLVLPASALLGATLLVVADVAARMLIAPVEIPIGVLTALLGGPFFLGLLLRRKEVF